MNKIIVIFLCVSLLMACGSYQAANTTPSIIPSTQVVEHESETNDDNMEEESIVSTPEPEPIPGQTFRFTGDTIVWAIIVGGVSFFLVGVLAAGIGR